MSMKTIREAFTSRHLIYVRNSEIAFKRGPAHAASLEYPILAQRYLV